MLETLNMNEKLDFQPLSAEEKVRRGILGRLSGPVASFRAPTRNGRKYDEQLWEKVFESPIVEELFSRGGIPGELDHPDREETCSEKIAIMMPEKPKKNKAGNLIGYFDILDTPCGRIAATLAKYGFQFGISSRGSGDTYTDYDGQECVDPDSYTLNAFDLVLIPACKEAVLNLVESFDPKTQQTLKGALNEALEKSTAEERVIMTEALDQLDIDYTEEAAMTEEAEEVTPAEPISDADSDDNIDVVEAEVETADDNGAEILAELQEALEQQKQLELEVKALQEKLSVCYTKEARYSATLERSKEAAEKQTKQIDALRIQVGALKESIAERDAAIQRLTESVSVETNKVSKLNEQLSLYTASKKSLNEQLVSRSTEVKSLTENLRQLQESFKVEQDKLKKENTALQESLNQLKTDSKIFRTQVAASQEKSKALVEKYRNVAKTAVDKYIQSKAISLGVDVNSIKKNLGENYSFNDIDRICEDLQRYKLNINALPFEMNKHPVRMKIKESKEVIMPVSTHSDELVDDDIDETLNSFVH